MSDYSTYVWRPVTGGRHAFPIAATKVSMVDQVTAFCGAEAEAAQLHDRSEVDRIGESARMDCWRVFATRVRRRWVRRCRPVFPLGSVLMGVGPVGGG
jgi:hypothetical protein